MQSKKFREALEDAMLRYTNKAITTAEMIARLIDLAKQPARRAEARRGTRPEQRGDRVLRRVGGERVGPKSDEERHASADGAGADRNGQEDAEARLDAARVRAGEPASQRSTAAGQVRLSARPRGGCDPTRAAAGGAFHRERRVNDGSMTWLGGPTAENLRAALEGPQSVLVDSREATHSFIRRSSATEVPAYFDRHVK